MTAITFGAIWIDGAAIQRLSSLLCLSLLHFLWQAAAVGLAAFVVGFVLKRRSARGEYLALILGLLSLPIVFAATIAWQRAKFLPPEPAENRAVVAAIPPKIFNTAPQKPQVEINLPMVRANSRPLPPPSIAAPAPVPQKKWDWRPFAPWLGGIYLLGVAAMFLRLLVGLGGARRLAREAIRIDDGNIFESLQALCRRIGLAASPRLAYCRDVSVPTLVGIVWPTILLPLSAIANLSPAELESILLHELVHIRRHDHLVNLAQRLVEAAFFFHPAVWLLSRRITTVREHCCDDAVLALGAQQSVYIDSLLRVAELGLASQSAVVGAPIGIQATGNGSRLRSRITRLLGEPGRTPLRLKPFALAIGVICLFGIIIAPLLLTTFAAAQRGRSELKPHAPKAKTAGAEQSLKFNGTVFDKASKKPVPGAIVMVHRWYRNEVEPAETSETAADSAGRYSFTISPEQAKSLLYIQTDARAKGFAQHSGLWMDFKSVAQSIAQSPGHEQHEDIELLAGQTVSGIAEAPDGRPLANCKVYFVSSTLSPPSRIDTFSQFVAGLRSDTLWRMLKIPANAWSEGTTTTDANGRFSFEAIFGASHVEFCIQPQEYVPLWHDCGTERGDFGTFRVRPGVRVSGSVVDEQGNPLKNVEVDIGMEYGGGVVSLRRGPSAHTDNQGHFEIGPVEPGAYWFSVDDSRFLPVRAIASADGPNPTVNLKPPALTTVRIHFVDRNGKPRTNRHGASLWAGDDTFPDSDQPGLAWMYFPLTRYHADFHWDGNAAVARVPQQRENSYADLHCASLDDWDGWYYRLAGTHDHWNLEGDGGGFVRMPRITGDSLDVTVVEAKLPSLIVRVVGPDGKPVSKFSHNLEYADAILNKPAPRQPSGRKPVKLDLSKAPPQFRASFAPLAGMLWSGGPASNEFTFDAIQPDEQFTVTISGGGNKSVSQTFNLKEGEHREATIKLVADGKRKSASKSAVPTKLGGIVVDKATGKPIAGATVVIDRMRIDEAGREGQLVSIGEPEKITVDSTGRFEFTVTANEAAIPGFSLNITAEHPGYVTPFPASFDFARLTAAIGRGEKPGFATIPLVHGENVGGVIIDPNGKPLANCPISFLSQQEKSLKGTTGMVVADGSWSAGFSSGNMKTDSNGRFTYQVFRNAETATLWVNPKDFAPLVVSVGSKRGDLGTFRVAPGSRFSGRVVDQNGKPLPGLCVTINLLKANERFGGSETTRESTTDANGRFSLDPVADGGYSVSVMDRRFLPQEWLLLTKNPPAEHEFRASPMAKLTVRFVDRTGRPSTADRIIQVVGTVKGSRASYAAPLPSSSAEAEGDVPRDLDNIQLMGIRRFDYLISWRIGENGIAHDANYEGPNWGVGVGEIKLPSEIIVTETKCPQVVVHVIGPDGKPMPGWSTGANGKLIAEANAWGEYAPPKPDRHGIPLPGNAKGDIWMLTQTGGVWRTMQLLPDHEFTITAEKRGYVSASQTMKLAEGESREITLKLVALPTQPKQRPAGDATKSSGIGSAPAKTAQPFHFSGTVIDRATRKPVAGATVIIRRMRVAQFDDYDREVIHSGRMIYLGEPDKVATDAEGHYEFTISASDVAIPEFHVAISAEHPGYVTEVPVNFDSRRLLKAVHRGEGPCSVIQLVRGETVSGEVADPQGKPLPNCEITFMSIQKPMPEGTTGHPLAKFPPGASFRSSGTTTTDANGRFSIEAIRGAAIVEVRAMPKNFAPLMVRVGTDRGDLGTLRADPGARFSGHVVDVGGKPIGGLRVTITSNNGIGLIDGETYIRETTTDADGHFSFDYLADDDYTVSVVDRRFLPQRVRLLAKNPPLAREFRASPMAKLTVRFVDRDGEPSTAQHDISVSGTANAMDPSYSALLRRLPGVAEADVPIDLRDIRLVGIRRVDYLSSWRIGEKGTPHDANFENNGWQIRDRQITIPGEIIVTETKFPEVTVHVVGPDGKPMPFVEISGDGKETAGANVWAEYSLPKPDRHGIPLPGAASGFPLRGNAQGDIWTMAQDVGMWRTMQLLPGHEFTITAEAPGCRSVSQTMKLAEGESREITLKLVAAPTEKPNGGTNKAGAVGAALAKAATVQNPPPAFEFRGVVSDGLSNKPIAGAMVEIRMAEPGALVGLGLMERRVRRSPPLIRTTTDAAGKYRVLLPPEFFGKRYLMSATATHPGYLGPDTRGWYALPIPADSDNHVDNWIDLFPAKKVSGLVEDQHGQPVSGCEITVSSIRKEGANGQTKDDEPTTTATDTAATDKQGRFNARMMRGATYAKVTISSKDFVTLRQDINPASSDAGTFHLAPGTRVTGAVVDGVGKPVKFEMLAMFPIGAHQPVRGMNTSSVYARQLLVASERTPAYGNWTSTDANGQFSFNPVANGRYQIDVLDRMIPSARNLGSRFMPVAVDISSKIPPSPIVIRGLPLADVRLHFVNRAGRTLDYLNTDVGIRGTADGHEYSGNFYPDDEADTARVPIGLKDVKIEGYVSGDHIIAWRIGDRGDLHLTPKFSLNIQLDSIKDATDVFVALIKPAEIRMQVVGPDGKPVGSAQPRIDYSDKSLKGDGPPLFVGDVAGDVSMQQLFPGTWQTYRLIPNQEFTLSASAAGFQTASQTMKLAEGESREVTVRLAADAKNR